MIPQFAPNQCLIVVSCLFAETKTICSHLQDDLPNVESGTWIRKNGEWTLDDCFINKPCPGAAHKKIVVAFSPEPKRYTLLTANLEDGWNSLAYRFGKTIHLNALILGFCDDAFPYPARFFSLVKNGTLVRHVSVRLDDNKKWLFFQSGEELPQEKINNYHSRLIRNRLTNEILKNLALSFDIDAFSHNEKLSGIGSKFLQK